MLFTANGKIERITQIPLEPLREKGVRAILADLDNTLAAYGQAVPTEEIRLWKQEVEAQGMTLFVLSNNRSGIRPRVFCQSLGVDYLARAGKPRRAGYQKALEQLSCKPKEAVMVGDQIFTDVLGARRAGIFSILVQPIRLAGNPGRYLRYGMELPFRMATKELKL